MLKVTLQASVSNYDVFDDTTPENVQLTARQQAVLLSAVSLFFSRRVWDTLTDSEWDDWEAYLAAIAEACQ